MSDKSLIKCLKLHLPWDLMCKRAEDLSITVPLEVRLRTHHAASVCATQL